MRTLYNIVVSGLFLFVLLGFLVVVYAFLEPSIWQVTRKVQSWYATPTPTPIPVTLDISSDDEAAAREAFYVWLREQHGLQAPPDPDLEDRAYYLAGEAPRLVLNQQWPQWGGARYAVGPAAGQWTRYWEGGLPCQIHRRSSPLATFDLDELPAADRVGAAVVWRNGEPYLAVVWPGMCPGPPVVPTFTNPGPTGPGW